MEETLKKLGCLGVLVWLAIAGLISTFFIMEYLERPDSGKSIWKAGLTVSSHEIIKIILKRSDFSSGNLLCRDCFGNWSSTSFFNCRQGCIALCNTPLLQVSITAILLKFQAFKRPRDCNHLKYLPPPFTQLFTSVVGSHFRMLS